MTSKWAVHFETKSGSIALNFNRPKRMESYKHEKFNSLTPNYNFILQIYFEQFQKV